MCPSVRIDLTMRNYVWMILLCVLTARSTNAQFYFNINGPSCRCDVEMKEVKESLKKLQDIWEEGKKLLQTEQNIEVEKTEEKPQEKVDASQEGMASESKEVKVQQRQNFGQNDVKEMINEVVIKMQNGLESYNERIEMLEARNKQLEEMLLNQSKEMETQRRSLQTELQETVMTMQARLDEQKMEVEQLEMQRESKDKEIKETVMNMKVKLEEQKTQLEQVEAEKESKEKEVEETVKTMQMRFEEQKIQVKQLETQRKSKEKEIESKVEENKRKIEENQKEEVQKFTKITEWIENSMQEELKEVLMKKMKGEESEKVDALARRFVGQGRFDLLQNITQQVVREVYKDMGPRGVMRSVRDALPELGLAAYRAVLDSMVDNREMEKVELVELAENLKNLKKLTEEGEAERDAMKEALPYSVRNIAFAEIICMVNVKLNDTFQKTWTLSHKEDGTFYLLDPKRGYLRAIPEGATFDKPGTELTVKNEFDFVPRGDDVYIEINHNGWFFSMGSGSMDDKARFRIDDCS